MFNAGIKNKALLSLSQRLDIKGRIHPGSSASAKPRIKNCFGHHLPDPLTQGNTCAVPLELAWSGWLAGRTMPCQHLSASTLTTPGLQGFRGPSGAFPGTPTPTHTAPRGWSPRTRQALCLGGLQGTSQDQQASLLLPPCSMPPAPWQGVCHLRFITRSISLVSLRFWHRAPKTLGTSQVQSKKDVSYVDEVTLDPT